MAKKDAEQESKKKKRKTIEQIQHEQFVLATKRFDELLRVHLSDKDITTYVKKIVQENLHSTKSALAEMKKGQLTTLKMVKAELARIQKEFKDYKDKIDNFDDTLLCTMHAIKKNQFLYSHYPDEWAKNYNEMKKGMKEENKYLEEQCEKKRAV